MKTNSRRYRRHRNPEITDTKESPFFSPTQKVLQSKEDAFFQPKLSVGQPGDKYEREADAVADKVVNQQPAKGNAVQRKEISAVQAMPEGKDEEKKEDAKKVQKKGQADKEEKKPEVATGKKEEEKRVQKKGNGKEEEKKAPAADRKEEEKPVQKKEEQEKKPAADEVLKEEKEEDKKGAKPGVMAKESNSRGMEDGGEQLGQRLSEQRGHGVPLSPDVKKEMGQAIGADFGNVRVHTGDKAAELSSDLGAQAFTHGNDVYFNSGKYDPSSAGGKHLLAHELTHVVQQGAAPVAEGKQGTPAAGHSTPGVQRETSTPLPDGVKADEQSEIAKFPIGDFNVEIKPDRKATKEENVAADHAETKGNIAAYVSYEMDSKKRVTKVSISKTLIIETIYGADATSKSDSGYGRGHIKSDKDKGNKSLGFHEGNHGVDFMEYVKTHPFPEIVIKKPVSKAKFEKLQAEWKAQHEAYVKDMEAISKTKTDDVTDPPAPAPAPAPAPEAPKQ
ncbi:eCIS core domain-containing protein [Chitinophaga pinensis]|uniref:eCIS core domain-containing protein n=1 Tax=Chitinophaga pinensis (strain ATCC 43595 / DSM 2588 / LMG 13176 / NBRC 15968 / NCIMB 11800 / UQM 2034) TaxID=485918 RepID=A0A979G847_CHIPD|nr:DUF4157 domain-containing protein [Chitinophaga pinensis]ACU62669.1 hypothetical protein Cpin_5238 [Chitinophaga pinensis DSM 2588]